jgi:hypothetical protein
MNPELTTQEVELLSSAAMHAKQLSELAAQYQKEAEGSSRDVSTIYKTIMQMKSLNPDAYSLSINSEAKTAELTPLAQAEPSKPDPAVVPAA